MPPKRMKGKAPRARRARAPSGPALGLLPVLKNSITVQKTFRFQVYNSNVSGASPTVYNITTNTLRNFMIMAVSGTTGYTMIEAIKLNSVTLFVQGSSQTPITITSEYPSLGVVDGLGGDSSRKEVTAMGTTFAAKLHHAPDPKTLQSNWVGNPADANIWYVFALQSYQSVSVGVTADVSVTFTLNNDVTLTGDIAPALSTYAGAGMTAGRNYIQPVFSNSLGTLSSLSTGVVQGWLPIA